MVAWKSLAAIVAISAIAAGPLVKTLLWLRTNPLDEEVGAIPILSADELSSRVKEKQVLLIGGTRGVGFGTAQAFAAAGAHVTIVGRSKESGKRAVSKLRDASGSAGSVVEFVQGDIGTVCSALDLVERLEFQEKRYDYAVVSAATFPDWTQPLQNEDGLDKSFAIAVVGRFLIYRNTHRFMKPNNSRVLNVMASGEKLPLNMFDKDIATGKRNVTSLLQAMMTFGIGNEIMINSLFKYDTNYLEGKTTMVSTHPGMLKTDLHRGQGILFDIVEGVMVGLIGRSEEEAGVRQSSILVSEKLHRGRLTQVGPFGYGRIHDSKSRDMIEENQSWLWEFLELLERNASCDKK